MNPERATIIHIQNATEKLLKKIQKAIGKAEVNAVTQMPIPRLQNIPEHLRARPEDYACIRGMAHKLVDSFENPGFIVRTIQMYAGSQQEDTQEEGAFLAWPSALLHVFKNIHRITQIGLIYEDGRHEVFPVSKDEHATE